MIPPQRRIHRWHLLPFLRGRGVSTPSLLLFLWVVPCAPDRGGEGAHGSPRHRQERVRAVRGAAGPGEGWPE
eukprot:6072782-Amphidinium_carterae.1